MIEDIYRRSGRTTRLVDEYIQTLFREKKVTIHDHHHGDSKQIHIDLGKRLSSIIKGRLHLEHNFVDFKTTIKDGVITFLIE